MYAVRVTLMPLRRSFGDRLWIHHRAPIKTVFSLLPLPTAEFEHLAPHLELVAMPLGEVLYESGGQLQHAYFPTSAIVSLHYVMENGASSEIAGVGNEGVLGIPLFMGGNTTLAGPSCLRAVMVTG